MHKPHAQWAKILLYTITASLALFLTSGLYYSYERKQALTQQRIKLEQIQREQDLIYQQQQQEYEQQMAEWRAEQERILQQNTQRMEQWRRNPVVRIRKEITQQQVVQEPQPELIPPPREDPSIGEPTGGSDPTAVTLPPPPAPAPSPIQAEPQYIIVERVKPQPEMLAVPEPPKPPTRVKVSKESLEFEMAEDTSWKTIAQLLVLLLGLYGGVRIINKYTRREEASA